MEEQKVQALHDTLAKLKKSAGLGVASHYNFGKVSTKQVNGQVVREDGLPNNPLYFPFVKEGTYDPSTSDAKKYGDGRVIKRNFDDCKDDGRGNQGSRSEDEKSKKRRKQEAKEKRKAEKKEAKRLAKLEQKLAEKKAAKLEAKRAAKLEAKRAAKEAKRRAKGEATETKKLEEKRDAIPKKAETKPKKDKKSKDNKKRKREKDSKGDVSTEASSPPKKQKKKKSKKKDWSSASYH